MQIILSFDNTAIDASEEYIFQAVSRNVVKESKEVEYEVTYQSSSFVNVMLYNIPDDFNELALNVGYVADDDILTDESAKKVKTKMRLILQFTLINIRSKMQIKLSRYLL